MANKVVNLVIKLKSDVSSKIKKIGTSLKNTVARFRSFAIAGVAAFAAVGGALRAIGKAYSEQENADKRLKSAFDAVGESGARAVAYWGAWATAVQRSTTFGDEEIMNLVSLAKVMGVANDKIAESTKGAIGLSTSLGIDLNSSMKMVALATQGEYTMLQRYIPALRAATTDAEKATIVQEAMAGGFKMAEDELDTLSGQWKSFKGVAGDALQEVGVALYGDGGLTDGIKGLKEALIELINSGDVLKWGSDVRSAFNGIIEVVKAVKWVLDNTAGSFAKLLTGGHIDDMKGLSFEEIKGGRMPDAEIPFTEYRKTLPEYDPNLNSGGFKSFGLRTDTSSALSEISNAQASGGFMTGENTAPIDLQQTNELLKAQNVILNERLGGVESR